MKISLEVLAWCSAPGGDGVWPLGMSSHKPQFDFVEFHILHHASERSLYGLWMIEELAQHGYKLNASQLYPRFHRLQKRGYLKRRDQVVDGKLRKYYRITPEGRVYLREQKRRLTELISEALSVNELSRALDSRRKREEAKRRSD
ncbi:MAG: PadR family transcriptional regulator [Acidobacteria bacterium]|nr:PadR family transcriptional regulator [Acidobacteriota bacterium]